MIKPILLFFYFLLLQIIIPKPYILFNFNFKRFSSIASISSFPGYDAYLYCIPKTYPTTYSTPRDLCITPLLGPREVFFEINLFSIRKSGCAATIIVLTNNMTVFSPNVRHLILLFNVQIVKGIFTDDILSRHTDFLRDTLCFHLLKEFKRENEASSTLKYERIFFFDSFDVYFEKDPFKYFERDDRLYFFQESYIKLSRSCNWFNRRGVRKCVGEEAFQSIKDDYVVCSGTIAAGSVDSFLRFLDLFVHLTCFTEKRCPYDQGALIYVVYSGMLNREKIHFTVFPPEGPVAACRYGPVFTEFRDDGHGNAYLAVAAQANNHTYEVVHQYQKFRKAFYAKTLLKKFLMEHPIDENASVKIDRLINVV